MLGDRDELMDRIQEEGAVFQERLKSAEARNALLAFMSRKRG